MADKSYLNVKYGEITTEIKMEGVNRLSDLKRAVKLEYGDDIKASAARIQLFEKDGLVPITDLDDIPGEYYIKSKDGGSYLEVRTSLPPSQSDLSYDNSPTMNLHEHSSLTHVDGVGLLGIGGLFSSLFSFFKSGSSTGGSKTTSAKQPHPPPPISSISSISKEVSSGYSSISSEGSSGYSEEKDISGTKKGPNALPRTSGRELAEQIPMLEGLDDSKVRFRSNKVERVS